MPPYFTGDVETLNFVLSEYASYSAASTFADERKISLSGSLAILPVDLLLPSPCGGTIVD